MVYYQLFLQGEEVYSLKIKFLSIETACNSCFKFSQIFTAPICVQMFSYLSPKITVATYLDLDSHCCFQIIQYQSCYHVPIY